MTNKRFVVEICPCFLEIMNFEYFPLRFALVAFLIDTLNWITCHCYRSEFNAMPQLKNSLWLKWRNETNQKTKNTSKSIEFSQPHTPRTFTHHSIDWSHWKWFSINFRKIYSIRIKITKIEKEMKTTKPTATTFISSLTKNMCLLYKKKFILTKTHLLKHITLEQVIFRTEKAIKGIHLSKSRCLVPHIQNKCSLEWKKKQQAKKTTTTKKPTPPYHIVKNFRRDFFSCICRLISRKKVYTHTRVYKTVQCTQSRALAIYDCVGVACACICLFGFHLLWMYFYGPSIFSKCPYVRGNCVRQCMFVCTWKNCTRKFNEQCGAYMSVCMCDTFTRYSFRLFFHWTFCLFLILNSFINKWSTIPITTSIAEQFH